MVLLTALDRRPFRSRWHRNAASLTSADEKLAISKNDCYQATSQHGRNGVKGA